MKRSEHSVRNSLYAIVGQAVSLLFGFVTRIAFVRILGEDYLGVNGVFYSVLSLLSLTELGIGAALTFELYKPIAMGDREKIGRVMNLYALTYRCVAAAVLILGTVFIPFLPWIARDVPEVSHLTLIYLLFLANSAASYLFSYKRALITASQQDYVSSINLCLFSVLQNLLQLVLLMTARSYLLYLAAQLVCTLASNLSISHTAGKLFPYLRGIRGLPTKEELHPIRENVRAMFLTRFGSVAVTGTDNLLIASVNVVLVGLYSNYLLILQTVQTILTQVINAVTASVGSLIASEDDKTHRRAIYGSILFAAAWLYGFSAIALDTLMGRFITLVFGAGLEIPRAAVLVMSLNFYIAGIRQPNMMVINAAGLFRYIKWRGFVEAAVNLTVSAIFLACGMELTGILLGTTVSHLAVGVWWEARCTAKHCVTGGGRTFIVGSLQYTAVILAGWALNGWLCAMIPENAAGFFASAAVTAILPNLIFALVFMKTKQFAFFVDLAKRMAGKLVRR